MIPLMCLSRLPVWLVISQEQRPARSMVPVCLDSPTCAKKTGGQEEASSVR